MLLILNVNLDPKKVLKKNKKVFKKRKFRQICG